MKTIIIIPARYGSTRLKAKPLTKIQGKTLIQRVYERCSLVDGIAGVYVATDHLEIEKHLLQIGADVIMTSTECKNGTERCAEALNMIEKRMQGIEIVVNVQGDEPFIHPSQIYRIQSCFENSNTQIATLVYPSSRQMEKNDPSVVKAQLDSKGRAIAFSRQSFNDGASFYKHIGIYGFKMAILNELTHLPETSSEKKEKLEQLRWLQNGYTIQAAISPFDHFSIDTEKDLERANQIDLQEFEI